MANIALQRDLDGHPGNGVVPNLTLELHVGRSAVSRRLRHLELDEHLVGRQGGLERVHQEVVDGDSSAAARSFYDRVSPQREHGRRMVVGRIGVGHVATHGGKVAHQRIGHHQAGLEERGVASADQWRRFQDGFSHHRSDGQMASALLQVRQARHPGDVDQVLRTGQPEFHEGDQALAAGQNLRLAGMALQKGDRLGK